MHSGIYTITNTVNGKMYVGLSTNINSREGQHLFHLKRNKHDNEKLQRAFNKYGQKSFLFELLVYCNPEHLFSEEHYWCNLLNVHDDRYGYNLRPTHPYGNAKMKDSTKEKLAIKNKNQDNSWRNKKIKQLTKEGVFIKEWESIRKASKETGISETSISNCCSQINVTGGGYIWQNANAEKHRKALNKRIVQQYSLDGNFICEYESARAAAKHLFISFSSIPTAIKANKTCKGFIWKYKEESLIAVNPNKKISKRKVLCVTTNILYNSIKEASLLLKIPACGIVSVCRGNQKTTHSLFFKYY